MDRTPSDLRAARHVAVRAVCLLLPLALIITAVNRMYYDPTIEYGHSSRYELDLARRLVGGYTLVFDQISAQDFDWRLMRKGYAQLSSAKPDVLVLGSSHTSDIGADSFPGRLVVNAAFAGGTYDEDAAIYWIYRRQGLIPSVVVIPLELYTLNAHTHAAVFESIERDYAQVAVTLGLPRRNTMFDLFNLAHVQTSLAMGIGLRRLDDSPQAYHAVSAIDRNTATGLAPDGSLFLGAPNAALHQQRVSESIAMIQRDWFKGFSELDPGEQALLERLLGLLARDHVQVLLYLPPIHPALYATLHTPAYPIVDAIERYYRSLADRMGLPLLGSYNPADCGLVDGDFRDGDHMLDDSLTRLFRTQRCTQGH